MSDTCVICLDNFNKSIRAPSECSYCHTKICRTCLQTYLLNEISEVPRCVNTDCRRGWEREFLDEQFTRTFRLTTYKEHREKVLADREKARLPSTQENAANYKIAAQIYKETNAELAILRKEEMDLNLRIRKVEHRQHRARLTFETFGRAPMPADARPATDTTAATGTDTETVAGTVAAATPKEKHNVFIKPCPAPDCKGFLSTAWKCGLCDLWTCPDCHDLKGPVRDCEHTCDPEKVASAQLLAREAKSCPKCGVQICKISGCDQMYCTVCNTGFNWRTGKVAEGPVHNPHYFEWLRRQGREPTVQGAQLDCTQNMDLNITRMLGGRPQNYYMGNRNRSEQKDTDDNYLLEAWRLMREYQDNARHEPNYDDKFRELRVRFMVGQMNEADWKVELQRVEKDMNFYRAMEQVRELFVGACRDLIRQVLEPGANKTDIRRQVAEMIQYCNTSYEAVAKRFGRKTPQIKIVLST